MAQCGKSGERKRVAFDCHRLVILFFKWFLFYVSRRKIRLVPTFTRIRLNRMLVCFFSAPFFFFKTAIVSWLGIKVIRFNTLVLISLFLYLFKRDATKEPFGVSWRCVLPCFTEFYRVFFAVVAGCVPQRLARCLSSTIYSAISFSLSLSLLFFY